MVSDRALGISTTVLFGISTLAWIATQFFSIVMMFSGMGRWAMILITFVGAIAFIARYAALIIGTITIFRTNRWNAGTGWLVTVWIITCWYGLLFFRDLIILVLIVFGASMFGNTMGEAVGYSSLPGRPPL